MMSLNRLIVILCTGFALLWAGGLPLSAQTRENLKIFVLQEDTKEPIPGALVKDAQGTHVTDAKGCATAVFGGGDKVTLSVKSLGYADVAKRAFTVKNGTVTIYMKPEENMLGTVNVDAQRRQTSILQQTNTIDAKTLEKSSDLSLAQLLEKVPGVSSISSGNSIAKPVIQGMHSSRILLVNNGVRLESQSWGIDHAPEIDHTASSIVEVIKGAESIRYGYGAVGGVVRLDQAPLPYGSNHVKVKGMVNTGYSTNSNAYDGAGTVDMGYKDFGVRLHGMYQRAGDYRTANYRLNNTGYKNISFSGLLGYHRGNITAQLYASLYYSRAGIYYGSKVSDIDQLVARFIKGQPEDNTIRPFSYRIGPPFQQSQHATVKGDINWNVSQRHSVYVSVSYQENLREEYENRKKESFSWLPVQDLKLKTFNAEGIWTANWRPGMNSQVGVSGMYQENYNVPGTKQPAFIPNFAALTTGFFLVHKMNFNKLTCSAGMRYDMRGLDVNGYTSLSSFKYYEDFKVYSNFTGSLAAHYQFSEALDARFNIGWAWRPPDINELYASGLHHGTYWVVGNHELTSERGYKAVWGGRYRNTWLCVEPSMFYQRITNYIYDNIGTGANRFHNHPSGKYPKFIYGQDNARFFGGDLTVTVSPYRGLQVCAKGEWINARNLSKDEWLPFMPSDRYSVATDYQTDLGNRKKWHVGISLEGLYVTKQNKFDPTKDLVPDSPPAYFLLGGSAEASTELGGGKRLKFILTGDNILNNLYKEYTDRFRYYAHERGSKFSLRTIFSF